MTNPSISYYHAFLDDMTAATAANWVETELSGSIGTFGNAYDDYMDINLTNASGNYYISYPDEGGASNLSLSSTVYTKCYYRYLTTSGAYAKIMLMFSDASGQTILDNSQSTLWTTGSATVTAGKTIDHIRIYALTGTGHVKVDFVMLCKGTFAFPNAGSRLSVRLPPRYAITPFPSRVGDITQNLGSELATVNVDCNLDLGNWKRAGDYANGEVFMEMAHRSYTEPWQWLDTGSEQFKVTLEDPEFIRSAEEDRFTATFREYRRSNASLETYTERFGLNL